MTELEKTGPRNRPQTAPNRSLPRSGALARPGTGQSEVDADAMLKTIQKGQLRAAERTFVETTSSTPWLQESGSSTVPGKKPQGKKSSLFNDEKPAAGLIMTRKSAELAGPTPAPSSLSKPGSGALPAGLRAPPPLPPVLSGHAASLTPY